MRSKEPQVVNQVGEIPQFWNRSVIYFSNILSIFYGNQGETDTLKDVIQGLPTYGGRLVPIIDILFRGGKNIVFLERRPNQTLLNYFQNELGLRLPRIELLHHRDYDDLAQGVNAKSEEIVNKFSNHDAKWIQGFVTDTALRRVADKLNKKTICSEEGSFNGNNKLNLHRFLTKQGLPTFDTFEVLTEDDLKKAVKQLKQMGYSKLVIKAQIGASGVGMVRHFINETKIPFPPDYYFHFGPALVQGWMENEIGNFEAIRSTSVQLFLSDSRVHLFDLTEQILNLECIHEGNYSPPKGLESNSPLRQEIFDQAEMVGEWLHHQKYRGTASIDFLVGQKQDSFKVYVCEVNARVTGATYPSVLARHFCPKNAWLMRNIRFDEPPPAEELLQYMRKTKALFHPGKSEGIIPINLNMENNRVQKGQFLFTYPSSGECWKQLQKIQFLIGSKAVYDRD